MNSMRMMWTTALLSVGFMIAACGGNTSPDGPTNPLGQSANGAFYAPAKEFAKAHPTRAEGKSWDGWCAALMVEFGKVPAAGDAIDAYKLSHIESKDESKAPVGALHWWKISDTVYHVGVDLNGGGDTVFMATTFISESWGATGKDADAIGVNSVDGYSKKNPSNPAYLGWSKDYAGAELKP